MGHDRDHAGLRTVSARDVDALSVHAQAWDRLAWESPQGLPSLLPDWVDAFLRHRLKPGETWFCSFAYDGDALVGALPVVVVPHPILGRWRPVLCTPFDDYTRSGDIALSPERPAPAFAALLAEAGRQCPGHLGLTMRCIAERSPLWQALRDGVSGYSVHRGRRVLYSFLKVDGDAKAYWAGLGKIRENVRRGRRKLEGRGRVSVDMRHGFEAGADVLPEFLDLEAAGWKGRAGTAIRNDPSGLAFFTRLVDSFGARGRWEWHAIRLDGHLAAAGMGVRCGAHLLLPKYAFDERLAECMPGTLLIDEIVRAAFARPEIAEISPMSRSAIDRPWRLAQAPFTDVRLVRRSAAALLFHRPGIAAAALYRGRLAPLVSPAAKEALHRLTRRAARRRAGP